MRICRKEEDATKKEGLKDERNLRPILCLLLKSNYCIWVKWKGRVYEMSEGMWLTRL
jgi:hypothetical protein